MGRAEQFAVIPLGLDLSPYDDWPCRRSRLRDELGIGETEILVGIVGRLTEVKNHRLFLEAVSHYKTVYAAAAGAKVRFVVIGNGHLWPALKQQVRELDLADDVTLLGLRNDPENFYPAMDIVALTSLNEGTPLTIIEAMANSRAVISTEVGGVADLLGAARPDADNGDSGYTLRCRGVAVAAGDAKAFCRGLVRLVGDCGLRQALGRNGRAFVERHCSKDRLICDMVALYEELLESAGR